jgi:hypothetical protein
MTKSDQFRENAGNCALLAERAIDAPTFKRYRMEEARKALAEEQVWPDGEVSASVYEMRFLLDARQSAVRDIA